MCSIFTDLPEEEKNKIRAQVSNPETVYYSQSFSVPNSTFLPLSPSLQLFLDTVTRDSLRKIANPEVIE